MQPETHPVQSRKIGSATTQYFVPNETELVDAFFKRLGVASDRYFEVNRNHDPGGEHVTYESYSDARGNWHAVKTTISSGGFTIRQLK